MQRAVIITDLDGTLLDPVTYSFEEALPALDMIRKLGVPLVFCSSKTRAELEVYRKRLRNAHPFISENGGGIFIPPGYFSKPVAATEIAGYQVITLGEPYADIRRRFARLREQMQANVRGFADMSIEEMRGLTGLTQEEAVLAQQRDFEEPFVFEGAEDQRFLQAIEAAGLCWTQGRMFHIMGRHDKGRAASMLLDIYRQQYGSVVSMGLGDGLNDLPLLEAVDRPVLVRHEDGSFDARIVVAGLVKTKAPGPAGWNEAVQRWLSDSYEADHCRENYRA